MRDLIASVRAAVREFKHRRALRRQSRRMDKQFPIPF